MLPTLVPVSSSCSSPSVCRRGRLCDGRYCGSAPLVHSVDRTGGRDPSDTLATERLPVHRTPAGRAHSAQLLVGFRATHTLGHSGCSQRISIREPTPTAAHTPASLMPRARSPRLSTCLARAGPLAKGIRADSLGILHSHLRRWYAGRALAGEVKVKTQSRECGWPLAAAGLIPGCQACLTSATEKCTTLPLTTPKVRYLHFSCKVFYMSSVNAMLIVVPGNNTGTAVVGPRLSAYPGVSGVALQYQLLARCPNPQPRSPRLQQS